MLAASADYIAQEARLHGARPAVRAVFLPYNWPNGVNVNGDFVECAFITPDRIQADFHGFTGGYWISEALTSNLQVNTSDAVITWTWNAPGYDLTVYYRGANDTTALAAAAWTAIESGATIQIYPYYQLKIGLEGVRAWAEDSLAAANNFSAWAEDTLFADSYQGYAEEQNVSGDLLTYVENVVILGEFTVVRDIEEAGSVSMEAPEAFDDLVAGAHSGLLLNNCQGSGEVTVIDPGVEIEYDWTPAPLFSPDKSSFFLAGQDWYNLQLKIQLGWSLGGWFTSEWGEAEWLEENFTEFITLFHGRVKEWGPVNRSVGSPNTVEVYAEDFLADCLQKRIALPNADGTPNPFIRGEFLCKANPISGWSPAAILKSAYFENNNLFELDQVVTSGGGAFSLISSDPLTGSYSARAAVTGASQSTYGVLSRSGSGEMFITGSIRFTSVPASPAANNATVLNIVNAAKETVFGITVDSTGALRTNLGGGMLADFNVLAYLDVPLTFSMWINPATVDLGGGAALWINGDEVLSYQEGLSDQYPVEFRFGAITGVIAESYTVDFDDVELRPKYYKNAFQVHGYPFESIGSVYIDNVAQPVSKQVGERNQTLARYPEWGMVQFNPPDYSPTPPLGYAPDFEVSGDVMVRVVENAGGRPALAVIKDLLTEAFGADVEDYMADPDFSEAYATLAAAQPTCPTDIINCRFEGGETEKHGFKDIASLGIPIADAIKEICARMMYWFFMDAGKIKVVPYTGTPPTSPALALTASNKWENNQTINLKDVNAFVSAIYGWYDRNPALFYLAGTQEAGGQGTALDYTWESPVCCESRAVVAAKAELLLKFLSAQDVIDPVSMSLSGARLELMTDTVSLRDELLNDTAQNYQVRAKEVNLDRGSRGTTLTLVRFLGET